MDEGADERGCATLTAVQPGVSARAILVLFASDLGSISAGALVAGLPLVRRTVLAAERAGWQPLVVSSKHAELQQYLAGTSAEMLSLSETIPRLSARRVLLLSMAVVPQPEWLRRLLEMPVGPDRLYVDRAGVAMVEAAAPGAVLTVASRSAGVLEAVAKLRDLFDSAHGLPEGAGRFVLTAPNDLPAAEAWLLRSLIKPNEGFMSRHFERRISLALTRRLCATRITPNAITLVSLTIGLAGAPFFLSAAPRYQLVGALLFLAHSILDGCDGELARLKFLESRWGALLDFGGDNLVHIAVFACMAVGWSLHSGSAWPLLLGGLAVASTLCIAAIVYRRGMRASTEGSSRSSLSRVADVVIYRDFIYLILLLAGFGKAHWFVALTAIGAPVFLILLAWLGRKG